VPVIYMTGNDTPAVREAALQSGCLAYLAKPFSAKSLVEPLKSLSEVHSALKTLPTSTTATVPLSLIATLAV